MGKMLPPVPFENLQRITIVPRCWEHGCSPIRKDIKTVDNFLCHIAAKYFPSLREIDIDLPESLDLGRQSFLSPTRRITRRMANSIRPLFIRTKDEGGLQFIPTFTKHRVGWVLMRILVMKKQEAACYGAGEDPTKHQAFLNYMGLCLWHVFPPPNFLPNDREMCIVRMTYYLTGQW
ncbi:hypothetical protein PGQ11_010525 [Apiospora arundinis]|uniref:Uncharacterized protein n=1 Tax=Apiospora arundinis TaxID=335852 RepID=A0ABR2IA34_9PEZI